METRRPAKFVTCCQCGKKADVNTGSNNWLLCDKCGATICMDCRGIAGSTSHTDHQPWGKWMMGSSNGGEVVFRN